MGCPLTTIERVCRSIGGLQGIRLVQPAQVAYLPAAGCGGTMPGELVLQDGELALDIPFATGTAELRERLVTGNRGGDYYEQELTCTLPGDQASVAQLLESLKNRRIHISTEDEDRIHRLLLHLRLEAEFATGQRRGERKGHRLRFTGRSVRRAPIWSGVITSGLPSDNWTDSDGGWFDTDGGWDDAGLEALPE